MRTNKPPLWILIDATNAIHRDAHAAGVTVAAKQVVKRVKLMIDTLQPACVIACFDPPGPTWRHRLEPTYKAGRARKEGVDQALLQARDEFFQAGIFAAECEGYEADDMIATLVDHAIANGRRAVIYSADQDLHQLLREGEVTQMTHCNRRFGKLEMGFVTSADLINKKGVWPNQWVDYKCLVGDTSDNLPGVAGIGPETAAKLLSSSGSIDDFYRNPHKAAITLKARTLILNAKPRIALLRDLFTLRRDVPLPELWMEAV